MKKTNYELSKKLFEIGFKAKAEKCWAKVKNSRLADFELVNLDFKVPDVCDEWFSAFDLETILEALPTKVFNFGLDGMSCLIDNEPLPIIVIKRPNQSLADTAARLLITLHEKGIIKFKN